MKHKVGNRDATRPEGEGGDKGLKDHLNRCLADGQKGTSYPASKKRIKKKMKHKVNNWDVMHPKEGRWAWAERVLATRCPRKIKSKRKIFYFACDEDVSGKAWDMTIRDGGRGFSPNSI